MPGPLSSTSSVTQGSSLRACRTRTVTVVPGGVCVRALASRLTSTCWSLVGSASTVAGASGSSSRQWWPQHRRGPVRDAGVAHGVDDQR